MARGLSTYLGLFLVIIGFFPFVGVSLGGIIQQITNILVVVAGVILILSEK